MTNLERVAQAMTWAVTRQSESVQRLAQGVKRQRAERAANQGFRASKPEGKIAGIAATSQELLFLEIIQFEIDLG